MTSLDIVRVDVTFDVDKRGQASYNEFYYGARGIMSGRGTYKIFHYQALKMLGIQEGDIVVVSTPSHGLTCATVKAVVEDWPATSELKWVVDKVDVQAYKDREERQARIRDLTTQLNRLANERKQRLELEQLIGDDPVGLKLLEELKTLKSSPTSET